MLQIHEFSAKFTTFLAVHKEYLWLWGFLLFFIVVLVSMSIEEDLQNFEKGQLCVVPLTDK